MPFEITSQEGNTGYYQVNKVSTSKVKTILPKFPETDNFTYREYKEGSVSGNVMVDTSTYVAAADIILDGEIIGPFCGNLKDGIFVKFDGSPEQLRVTLRPGSEVWVQVGEKDKKVMSF